MDRRLRMRSGWTSLLCALVAALSIGSLSVAGAATQVGVTATKTETYRDIPVGITPDGDPFQGNPNAPLTLIEYSDYLCPFCERHFRQSLPTLLEKYVRTGKVRYVVRDFPLVSLHPTAPRGSAAAGCVAEQGAARFWRMHERLFQSQREWNRLPDPTGFLARLAQEVGADGPGYEACMASGRQGARVERSVAAATALGFNGTPTFQFVHESTAKTYTLIGSQPVEVFARWIDDLLAGKEPPAKDQTEPPRPAQTRELPFWAKPEGRAPDPKRPGFTLAGDPYRGNPDAKFVIFEFADFQCPSCQRHALTTQPELDKRFVDTGQVRWVFKHFPLGGYPRAAAAAAAATCAGDHGKFWVMHHALFERMEQWSTSGDPNAALTALAVDLGIDKAQFTDCVAGRGSWERVLRDVADGHVLGVRQVPSFIVFRDERPVVVVGARATERFVTLLEGLLKRLSASAAESVVTGTRGR